MYNDTLNGGMFNGRDMEELPEAIGPVAQLQEKLYVPVKEYPDVSGQKYETFDPFFFFLEELLFTLVCCLFILSKLQKECQTVSEAVNHGDVLL